MSFKYRLELATPDSFAGGTNRTATRQNISGLKDIAMYSMRIEPGGLRELHWHPNVGELNYCLQGQGTIGILTPEGETDFFPIQPGSVSFIPTGYAHFILNGSQETLHLITVFSHAEPEHIDISSTLEDISRTLWAQTFNIPDVWFPDLPQQGDQFLVKRGQPLNDNTLRGAKTSSSHPFTFNMNKISAHVYAGGTVQELTTTQIPSLDGLTLFLLNAYPEALREPHWHPNAGELDYCVSGTAQMEILGPNGQRESFVIEPGDVAYIPQNYLHYIDNMSNDPLQFLVFFSNNAPTNIDFSQVFTSFSHELLAASFGSDLSIFNKVPQPGNIFLAAKRQLTGA
jgi:oxalate decarboxylase